jgi:hypothetical protein
VAEVTLTVVPNELEADMLCGMLQANGIACSHRTAGLQSTLYGSDVGGVLYGQGAPTEVLVEEEQLDEARKLLPRDG